MLFVGRLDGLVLAKIIIIIIIIITNEIYLAQVH